LNPLKADDHGHIIEFSTAKVNRAPDSRPDHRATSTPLPARRRGCATSLSHDQSTGILGDFDSLAAFAAKFYNF